MDTEAITIATPPAIHVDPIVNPVTNETISIVIPLSAQLATVVRATIQPYQDCNDIKSATSNNTKAQTLFQTTDHQVPSTQIQKTNLMSTLPKADKTKGCPFPTCSRYGRAFSRAHDLKRHIARHETRKERLSDLPASDMRTCGQCGEHFLNDAVLERHMNVHAIPSPCDESGVSNGNTTPYPCNFCNKRYTQLSKLKAHIATHDKNLAENICTLCGDQSESAEKLEDHMKKHTSSILEAQNALKNSESPAQNNVEDDTDDFMLEEMLLLNKNPRVATAGKSSDNTSSSSGKIRCDYCSKTFKTKWTLSSHVAAHEGRYQFVCSRCGKKFVRKSHYDGHVRSHEAARPYLCDQCGKTFKELKHRREHTKRKHPGNQNAIQNLLDSISACVAEESSVEQTKFTLLMPMNFTA